MHVYLPGMSDVLMHVTSVLHASKRTTHVKTKLEISPTTAGGAAAAVLNLFLSGKGSSTKTFTANYICSSSQNK